MFKSRAQEILWLSGNPRSSSFGHKIIQEKWYSNSTMGLIPFCYSQVKTLLIYIKKRDVAKFSNHLTFAHF